jgi:hypothetical protein
LRTCKHIVISPKALALEIASNDIERKEELYADGGIPVPISMEKVKEPSWLLRSRISSCIGMMFSKTWLIELIYMRKAR